MRRGIHVIIRKSTGEVDAKGDNGDAEAGSGVAELLGQHWMLPPLIPPTEELPGVTQ